MRWRTDAPGCDYADTFKGKRSVFQFPTDPVRLRAWLKSIPRKNFAPTKHSKICEVHFEERFISRTTSAIRLDGTKAEARLTRPKLASDAIPTLFQMLYELSAGSELAIIMKLNRGGLSIPTGLTRTVCRYCYLVFSMLTAASSQDLFLKGTKSQRDALIQIAFNFLSRQCENSMSETCHRCLIPVFSLSEMLLKVCATTMLNMFQRKKNDKISRKKQRDNDSLQMKKFRNYSTLCLHYCQRDCNDSDEKKR